MVPAKRPRGGKLTKEGSEKLDKLLASGDIATARRMGIGKNTINVRLRKFRKPGVAPNIPEDASGIEPVVKTGYYYSQSQSSYIKAIIKKFGKTFSDRELSFKLGVSRIVLRTYRKRAGVPPFKPIPSKLSDQIQNRLPGKLNKDEVELVRSCIEEHNGSVSGAEMARSLSVNPRTISRYKALMGLKAPSRDIDTDKIINLINQHPYCSHKEMQAHLREQFGEYVKDETIQLLKEVASIRRSK